MPKRIQRKRTKGWRMPEGAVYVGRPTKWGNPFWHTEKYHGLEAALAFYRNMAEGVWSPSLLDKYEIANAYIPYNDQQEWLARLGGHPVERAQSELRGKDLACWCPLDRECHADILLELANGRR